MAPENIGSLIPIDYEAQSCPLLKGILCAYFISHKEDTNHVSENIESIIREEVSDLQA